MRPRDYDGPFPKNVFPTSLFPRRIFPWMGGDDEEGADENKHSTPDRQRNNEDKDKE